MLNLNLTQSQNFLSILWMKTALFAFPVGISSLDWKSSKVPGTVGNIGVALVLYVKRFLMQPKLLFSFKMRFIQPHHMFPKLTLIFVKASKLVEMTSAVIKDKERVRRKSGKVRSFTKLRDRKGKNGLLVTTKSITVLSFQKREAKWNLVKDHTFTFFEHPLLTKNTWHDPAKLKWGYCKLHWRLCLTLLTSMSSFSAWSLVLIYEC